MFSLGRAFHFDFFLCLQILVMPPSPTCHFPNLFSSPWAQRMAQTMQQSFKSHLRAHAPDLLLLALLLSLAINFNQILCTLLYSCLKPSKMLLLLRKPLPVILTLISTTSFLPFPSPHVFLGSKGQPWHH